MANYTTGAQRRNARMDKIFAKVNEQREKNFMNNFHKEGGVRHVEGMNKLSKAKALKAKQ